MNYWMCKLSDGTEVDERNFTGGISPWQQFGNLLKQKPDVAILEIVLFVNGTNYRLPVNDKQSLFFRGHLVDNYCVARRISQELIFVSNPNPEYFIVGYWVDRDIVNSISINTMDNSVILASEILTEELQKMFR